jgi:hypothetical protein
MSLREKLNRIRQEAHSLDSCPQPDVLVDLIEEGNPWDLMFFRELRDPRWLPILQRAGFFDRLPTTIIDLEGRETYPYSLPLTGLYNIAEAAPVDVTRTLLRLKITPNPVVLDQVLRVIAKIQDQMSIHLVSAIVCVIASAPRFSNILWLEEVLKKWIETNNHATALDALNNLFLATAGLSPKELSRVDESRLLEIDSEVFSKVCEVLPHESAEVAFRALQKWAASQRTDDDRDTLSIPQNQLEEWGPDFDNPGTFWLRDFTSRSANEFSIETTLSHRLYAAVDLVFSRGLDVERVDRMLRSDPWHLFRRLRWKIYSVHPAVSLDWAREEVLIRAVYFNRIDHKHESEFAEMVERFSEDFGTAFLNESQVEIICETIHSGPLTETGTLDEDEKYRKRFFRDQLAPFANLFDTPQLEFYKNLIEKAGQAPEHDGSLSGGAVEFREIREAYPFTDAQLSEMEISILWSTLNDWKPSQQQRNRSEWWREESERALATTFSDLVFNNPARFSLESQWWTNISRPSVLERIIDRATDRIGKSESSESNATQVFDHGIIFLICLKLMECAEKSRDEALTKEGSKNELLRVWDWPRLAVARFISTALESKKFKWQDYERELKSLIPGLLDCRLRSTQTAARSWLHDWYTTAINSASGIAFEALLRLTHRQKESGASLEPSSWALDMANTSLKQQVGCEEIYAVAGARLRLMAYLFPEMVKEVTRLGFRQDSKDLGFILIVSHMCYDQPSPQLLERVPGLLEESMRCLRDFAEIDEKTDHRTRDFGFRFGYHLSWYFWNNFLPESDADRLLDEYFSTADESSRRKLISQIASMFRDVASA